jgi:hypothetical protein
VLATIEHLGPNARTQAAISSSRSGEAQEAQWGSG